MKKVTATAVARRLKLSPAAVNAVVPIVPVFPFCFKGVPITTIGDGLFLLGLAVSKARSL